MKRNHERRHDQADRDLKPGYAQRAKRGNSRQQEQDKHRGEDRQHQASMLQNRVTRRATCFLGGTEDDRCDGNRDTSFNRKSTPQEPRGEGARTTKIHQTCSDEEAAETDMERDSASIVPSVPSAHEAAVCRVRASRPIPEGVARVAVAPQNVNGK